MPVNANHPERWKADIARSIDLYNDWFMRFAPEAYRSNRAGATELVLATLQQTANLTQIHSSLLQAVPTTLPVLRMSTCASDCTRSTHRLGRCLTNAGARYGTSTAYPTTNGERTLNS